MTTMLTAVTFIYVSISFVLRARPWIPIYRTSADAMLLNVVQTGAYLVSMSSSALCFGVAKRPVMRKRLGTRGFEMMLVGYLSVLAVCVPLTTRPYMARLFGHEPEELLQKSWPSADTFFLMNLDLIVTAAHVSLPIRWTLFWPFDLTCCCVYILTIAKLGNLQAYLGPFSVGFILLVSLASAGLRSFEAQERSMFLVLLDEKKKRFNAEFRLHQSEESSRSAKGPSIKELVAECSVNESSIKESFPSTTLTGQAFATAAQDLPLSFERLVSIGEEEQWLLPASDIRLLPDRILGRGGFGMVMRGEYNGSEVAVKAPVLAKQLHSRRRLSELVSLCNELRLLRRLRHPNIVVMFGACLDSQHGDMVLVLELLQGQSLQRFVTSDMARSVARVQVLADVGAALAFLHGRRPPIVHGDLTASNIFVEDCAARQTRCRAKLLDFGLSMRLTKRTRARGGSVHWMAPEMAVASSDRSEALTTKADIFSLGRVVYFVVIGITPHVQLSQSRLLRLLRQRQVLPLIWPHPNSTVLGPSHRELVELCCREDPAQRPGIMQVQRLLAAAAREALSDLVSEPAGPEGNIHEMLERAREVVAKGLVEVGACPCPRFDECSQDYGERDDRTPDAADDQSERSACVSEFGYLAPAECSI